MEQYLIDSNVISDYFSTALTSTALKFMDKAINAIPKLSVITQIELLCWKTDASSEQKVKDFLVDSVVLNINPDIIFQCVNLRKGKKIKTPDAIIAATALAYGFTLITSNEKDFAHITNLKIINPHKL